MQTKIKLTLSEEDADSAWQGLVLGCAGTLAADTAYKLEYLINEATQKEVEVSRSDIRIIVESIQEFNSIYKNHDS